MGLFLLSVLLWDVREECSPSDTGCQLVSRRPSLAEEQWGSLLSPLLWPVSPPVERDKREGIWLSWHSGADLGLPRRTSGTLCSENDPGLATGAEGAALWERVCTRGSGMRGFPLLQRGLCPAGPYALDGSLSIPLPRDRAGPTLVVVERGLKKRCDCSQVV